MPRVKPLPKYLAGLALVGVLGYFGWKAMDKLPAQTVPTVQTQPEAQQAPAQAAAQPEIAQQAAPAPQAPAVVDPGLAAALKAGNK